MDILRCDGHRFGPIIGQPRLVASLNGIGLHAPSTATMAATESPLNMRDNARLGPEGHRRAPIVRARNYSQPHSQEARVGRLVPIVIVTAIDIFYRLGDLVGVLPDIVQRGDSHCVELTSD
jgi:hypothetical protein